MECGIGLFQHLQHQEGGEKLDPNDTAGSDPGWSCHDGDPVLLNRLEYGGHLLFRVQESIGVVELL